MLLMSIFLTDAQDTLSHTYILNQNKVTPKTELS